MQELVPWYRQKTTLTGIIAIVSAGIGAATGTLPIAVAIQTGLTGLIGIFLRQGVEKIKLQKETQDGRKSIDSPGEAGVEND